MRVHGALSAAAMQRLAEFFATTDPDVAAFHGIDVGDALALATRFDRGWAHRGGQALLWNARFAVHEVRDGFLPSPALRVFERRGFLRVDGVCERAPLTLFATEFSDDQNTHIYEVRFARTLVRKSNGSTLLFAAKSNARFGFSDLGLTEIGSSTAIALKCFVRERVCAKVEFFDA